MAIDRKEFLDKAFFGIGTVGYGTISPLHFAYDAELQAVRETRCRRRQETDRRTSAKVRFRSSFWCRRVIRPFCSRRNCFRRSFARPISMPRSCSSSSPRFSICRPSTSSKASPSSAGADASIPDPNTYDHLVTGQAVQRFQLLEQRCRQISRRSTRHIGRGQAQRCPAQGRTDLRRRRPGARLASFRRLAAPDGQGAERHGVVPGSHPALRDRTTAKVTSFDTVARSMSTGGSVGRMVDCA